MVNEKIHIGNLGAILVHEPNPLADRLAALDQLKDIATQEPFTNDTIRSTKAIAAGLYSEPSLLKQKCVYALGQCRYPPVVPILQEQLVDKENHVGSRVEAAKGLALLRYPGQEVHTMIDLLTVRYDDEEVEMVKDAAEVAAARISWELKGEKVKDDWFGSVDLAPPFVQIPEVNSIDHLADILLNTSENLFNRCRAMTSLRNLCIDQESTYCDSFTIIKVVQALTGAHQAQSTFLRYQLVLTLGQINHESTVPYLLYQLQNDYSEDSRVRAAAAEALAALTYENEVEPFMEDFKEDESELVRDFVALALRRAQESQQ